QRLFIDLTSTLRGRVGRKLMPRMLDVMEARSATILRRLLDDPRLSVTRRSPLLFVRRVLHIALRYAAPLQILQALASPEAARARVARIGEGLTARLTVSDSANAGERLDVVQRALGTESMRFVPTTMTVAAAGLGMLAVAGKLLGDDGQLGDLLTVLRGLPHNVTSEMDLALWDLAAQIRKDETSTRVLRDEPAAELAREFHLGTLPPPARRGLAEFLSRY